MSPEKLRRAEELYFALAAIPRDDRPAVLDAACAHDRELRTEVESLLKHAEELNGFLDNPALGHDFSLITERDRESEIDDLVGRPLGHYRIEERLAAGGMGVVYRAVRGDKEFTQQVAIKVVKRGMDSEEILRRFRQERQTLAALNHPNIARLYDGGVTADGRPYLVMEFVEGLPIDRYCDLHKLSIAQRLQLFRTVCLAVQYAHQNLVVHRDLKPNNILVTREGTPKLLDFGISKVVASTRMVNVTSDEHRRLTPEYASPEQVRGLSVTTATDVYSLGVILYELLCGQRPYQFRTRTMTEIERIVSSVEPLTPSDVVTRLVAPIQTGTTDTAPTPHSISATRDGSPERLRSRLRGELDNIVLMALRKEPSRRYSSAEALAADIERFNGGLPVSAQRDTVLYRTRKFITRHRWGAGLGALAACAILSFMVIIVHQSGKVRRERDDAYSARDQSEAVVRFLVKTIEAADPQQLGANTTVEYVLDHASEGFVEGAQKPLVRASVESALGRAYIGIGEYARAEAHLNRAYQLRRENLSDPSHHDIAESKMDLAMLYHATARYSEAEKLLHEALTMHTTKRGEENEDTARVYNDLGAVLRLQGRLDEAEQYHRRALLIRRKLMGAFAPHDLAESLNNLAGVLRQKNQFESAEQTMTEALAIRRAHLRADHPLVVQAIQNLGTMAASRNDHIRAESLFIEALTLGRQVFRPGHPQLAFTLQNLGSLYVRTKRANEGEPLLREALEIRTSKLLPNDPAIFTTKFTLARCLLAQDGKTAEGERLFDEGLTTLRRADGTIEDRWRQAVQDYATHLESAGRPFDAAQWRETLAPAK